MLFLSRILQYKQLLISFLFSLFFISLLCFVFQPQYQSNDDVVMGMAAHGFGVFDVASSNIVFSNIIWGALIHITPSICGLNAYSVVTVLTLFFVTWALSFFLIDSTKAIVLSLLVVTLVISRAVLYPQFTINAGLLTVTALIALFRFAMREDKFGLYLFLLFAYLGYLVRSQEFLLVLAISIPFIPYRKLICSKYAIRIFLLLSTLIFFSEVINSESYQGKEWTQFKENLAAQQPYVNYGASTQLKERQDITSEFGYSNNDLDLLSAWFYVDPKLANSSNLNLMATKLGSITSQEGLYKRISRGLHTLSQHELLPLFFLVVVSIFLFSSTPLRLSLIILVSVAVYLGIIGRPGISRVFYPLLCFLIISPLIISQLNRVKRSILLFFICLVCIWNFSLLYRDQIKSSYTISKVQSDIGMLPHMMLFVWGGAFPFESAYPVLSRNPEAYKLKLYSLGWNTLAPNSVSATEERRGNGFVHNLTKPDGLLIIADPGYHGRLIANYCIERLHGQPSLDLFTQFQTFTLLRAQCQLSD